MPLWGNTDDAANSVSYAPSQYNKEANTANKTALFGNTTAGAIVGGKAVGQFGVSSAEMANTSGEGGKVTHSGWVLREAGTGPVISVAISNGGTGYTNTDTFTVVSPGANATGTITTNGTGVITVATLISGGDSFTDKNPTVTITTSSNTASGGVLTATAGGRAGRVTYETLVAMNTITGDASDDALLPE